MSNTIDNAQLLIKEINDALSRGTKHYRISDNKPLLTNVDIIQALIKEGAINFEPIKE